MWCVALPGKQSIFNPNPGICHECIISYELVIAVIFTCAGNTNTRFALSNRFQVLIDVLSNLFLDFLNNLYCFVGVEKFSSSIDMSLRNGFPEYVLDLLSIV